MSSAKVLIAEIDRSSYIPESNGVYGAMVIPLVRGDTKKVGFASSEEKFLKDTTPEGRIEPGFNLGYYQALDFFRGSNKLLYVRAANNPTFGGVIIPVENSNKAPVRLNTDLVDPLDYIFRDEELFLLYGNSEGDWSRHVGYKIMPYTKLVNSFVIQVFWKSRKVEEFIVSRDPDSKDGNGQNMFIENVLKQSAYVRCLDNAYYSKDVLPLMLKPTTTKWNDPVKTNSYTPTSPAEPKQESLTIPNGNFLSVSMPMNISGVPFLAPPGASKESIAAAAATANFSQAPTVEVLTSKDNKVNIFFKASSGDSGHCTDFFSNNNSSTLAINFARVNEGTPTVAKTVTYVVSGANGANSQYVVIEGVAILIEPALASNNIAAAIAAKSAQIVAANPQLASVTASMAEIVFTYKVSTAFKPSVQLTVGSALPVVSSSVIQTFSPRVKGTQQVVKLMVTNNASATGALKINTMVNVLNVSLTSGMTSLQIAAAIGTAFNADPKFDAKVDGVSIEVTYIAEARYNAMTVDAGATGVQTTVQITTTGKDPLPAVLKKCAVEFGGGNPYSFDMTVNLCGTPVVIPPSATSGSAVASALAASTGWSTNQLVQSVSALGSQFIITFAEATGSDEDIRCITGLTKMVTTAAVLEKAYKPAGQSSPTIIEVTFTDGNTSAMTEIIYIDAIPVVVKRDSNTASRICDDVISAQLDVRLPTIASIAKSASDPRTLVFTYDLSAGEVDSLSVESSQRQSMTNGGGTNGGTVTDTQMIKALDLLKDRDFNVSMDAGWCSPAYQKAMAAMAEKKMNHIALLSVPYESEANSDYINALLDYRNNKLNLNTSYAALYSGYLKIRDKFNDRDLWIAPTGTVGALISNTITKYEPWYPVSGDKRGQVSWAVDVLRHYEEGEMDILQDAQINPILFDPGKGIKVWGQRTLQSFPSALDRVNVRLLCIYVEMAMKEFLNTILWELHTIETRERVVAESDKFMEGIKSRKGIYAYKNICDESNNTDQDVANNRMVFQQQFEPVKSIETIKYEPVIMSPGSI